MTTSPDMRSGDEDRDRTISSIREAFAQGRLSDTEFQDRLSKAQHATTFGDLAELTKDLPVSTPPAVQSASTDGWSGRDYERNWKRAWMSWLLVAIVVNVIWGITYLFNRDHVPYYWPIWVMVPWGLAMLLGWVTSRFRS